MNIEDDLHGWLLEQTSALRSHRHGSLDWSNLAEELDAMAASQRRELKNRLHVLLLHLLQWQTQPGERQRRGRGWMLTIREERRHITDLLKESPSLKRYLPDLLADAWKWACEDAVEDAPESAPVSGLPATCPWSYDEFIARDFLPAD